MFPPTQACDHPCYDLVKGERLLKDVYEALRAGPKWEKTLLLVAYDDAGTFYDHVSAITITSSSFSLVPGLTLARWLSRAEQ